MRRLKPPISRKTPIVLTILGVISLVFVLLSHGWTRLVIAFDSGNRWTLDFSLPARETAAVATTICLLLAAYSWLGNIIRRLWLPIVFGITWVFAFLVWAGAGQESPILVTNLLSGALFFSAPLIFGALAGCVCEHVGVINVAIEGDLLFGAFLAAIVGALTGNAWFGLLAAPVAGALVGCLLALFAVRYWVDHIIVGIVLNVLVLGLTNYFFNGVMQANPRLTTAVGLPALPVPLLRDIPIVGPVFFNGNILLYLMYAVVAGLQFMLFHSRWGLRMRACGEHPQAAGAAGIKVNRTRVRNVILGSAIAGLGGAFFTVARDLTFTKNISSGQGYIALAAMILGRWKPVGAVLACLLFGFALNAQQVLAIVNTALPTEFMNMAPYLITIVAVAALAGKVRPPAMEGVPYGNR